MNRLNEQIGQFGFWGFTFRVLGTSLIVVIGFALAAVAAVIGLLLLPVLVVVDLVIAFFGVLGKSLLLLFRILAFPFEFAYEAFVVLLDEMFDPPLKCCNHSSR